MNTDLILQSLNRNSLIRKSLIRNALIRNSRVRNSPIQISFALCLLIVLAGFAQAQTLPLRAGVYDISTTMTINGQSGEPTHDSRCLSQEQLAEVENVFNLRPMAGVCTVSMLAITSKKISYHADCPNTLVQVAGVVDTDSFAVLRTQKAKQANGAESLTKFEGKFAGACR